MGIGMDQWNMPHVTSTIVYGSAKSHFAHLWYKYGTFSCRTKSVRKVQRNPSMIPPVEGQIYMCKDCVKGPNVNQNNVYQTPRGTLYNVHWVNADHGTIKMKEYHRLFHCRMIWVHPSPPPTPPHASEKRWPTRWPMKWPCTVLVSVLDGLERLRETIRCLSWREIEERN
jgi:hypothetical protein